MLLTSVVRGVTLGVTCKGNYMEPTTLSPSDNTNPNSSQETAPTPSPKQPDPPINKSPSMSKKLLMFLMVILLLVGAAAAYMFFKPESSDVDEPVAVVKNEIPLLKVGTEGPYTDLYPDGDVTVAGGEIIPQIYEGLVAYEAETNIVPSLALSWTNPDDLTWVFKLKPNVKFHSGRTMTAKDVKYGIEASKGFPFGDYFGATISEVVVVDDLTIRIKTSEPDPILLNKLVFLRVLDSEIKETTPLAGTGPYTLKPGTEITASKLELVAFDDYHGGRPLVRELVFLEYSDTSLIPDALEKNEIDVGYARKRSIAEALKPAGFAYLNFDSLTINTFSFNSVKADSPFRKKEVREAFNLAIDRQKLIEARDVDAEPRYQIQSTKIPGFDPSIKPTVRDTTKAKELLVAAGYPNGLTIKVSHFDVEGPRKVVDELKKQLAEVGISVISDPQVSETYFEDLYGGKFDIGYISISSDLLDGVDVVSNLLIDNEVYDDSLIDELYAKVNTTLDAKQRLEYLQEISQIVFEDNAVAPLYEAQLQVIYKDTLHLTRDIAGANLGIYWWNVYQ